MTLLGEMEADTASNVTAQPIDFDKLTLAHWNVNGWTDGNCELRKAVFTTFNPDIISLNESHLTCQQVIEMSDYTFYGYNRQMHFRAVKGSGGVGFLVKNILFERYEVTVNDKSMGGILAIKLKNKFTDYCFVVFTCYLPPEGSPRILDPNLFFGHLLAQMYSLSDVDAVYVCGDFNGRIGKLNDCITDVDDMLPRTTIDSFVNGYGQALVEFLKDAKCCVLNGRILPEKR